MRGHRASPEPQPKLSSPPRSQASKPSQAQLSKPSLLMPYRLRSPDAPYVFKMSAQRSAFTLVDPTDHRLYAAVMSPFTATDTADLVFGPRGNAKLFGDGTHTTSVTGTGDSATVQAVAPTMSPDTSEGKGFVLKVDTSRYDPWWPSIRRLRVIKAYIKLTIQRCPGASVIVKSMPGPVMGMGVDSATNDATIVAENATLEDPANSSRIGSDPVRITATHGSITIPIEVADSTALQDFVPKDATGLNTRLALRDNLMTTPRKSPWGHIAVDILGVGWANTAPPPTVSVEMEFVAEALLHPHANPPPSRDRQVTAADIARMHAHRNHPHLSR